MTLQADFETIDDLGYPEPIGRPRLVEAARALEPLLLESEARIERERKMPAAITDALYDSGIYRAFLPAELGGLDAHPLEWLEAVEEVSRVNGSAGWLCMLHTGATWAQPEAMRRILENERWITAGNVGRASGTAKRVDGGYIISGRWPFCSGSPEATYLYGRSVLVNEDDEPQVSPRDGLPYYISGYIPAKDVTLYDTWDGMGLRGTGSGDISVENVFVPTDMVNETGIWTHPYDSPLQHANFNLMAHSAHALGLATAAVEEFTSMTQRRARKGSIRQERLGKDQTNYIAAGKADAQIRAARLFMRDVVGRAYEDAKTNVHIDYELRVLMHEVNTYVVDVCRQVIDGVFREAGASAVFRGVRLERIFRDIMTAAQHIVITASSIDRAGQYWLTKDLDGGPQVTVDLGYIRGPHPQNDHRWNA